jgi:hypothetical protein
VHGQKPAGRRHFGETVRIYKLIGGFRQPDPSALPKHFKPDVTVNSGPPAKPPRKKKGH